MIERMIPLSFELYHALRTLYDEEVAKNPNNTSYGLGLAKAALDKASHYETFTLHG